MIDPTASVLAVVPARGGSKGIPGKNLVNVAGRPLIAWTLLAVAEASLRMRLVVTTDSPEIAEVSLDYGAEIVARPPELARDTSPTEPAVGHVIEELQPGLDNALMLLQATSPVRLPGTLDRAHEAFASSGADSMVAVVEESPFLWRGPTASPSPAYVVDSRPRRQDFREKDLLYRETGSLYESRVAGFVHSGNRIHGRCSLFVLDSREGTDIDTPYDLTVAESILASLGGERP